MDLVNRITGLRGVSAGRLRLSRQVEHMTAVLIAINKQYGAHASFVVTNIAP